MDTADTGGGDTQTKRSLEEDTLLNMGEEEVDTDTLQAKEGFAAMAKQKNPNISEEEISKLAALQESVELAAKAARSKM